MPNSSAITHKKAFNLRQNMLLFVQNLEYYMFEEVIETQWQAFTSAIQYKVLTFHKIVNIIIKCYVYQGEKCWRAIRWTTKVFKPLFKKLYGYQSGLNEK